MSEQTIEPQVPEGAAPEQQTQEPSYSEVEVKAMSMGWRPQDQWDGNQDDWVDAKEFVGRKSLFDKIDHQSRKIKELEKTMSAFKNHYDQVNEAAYQRALNDLKQQKRAALANEDATMALKIDDQIDQMQEARAYAAQQQRLEQAKIPDGPTPAFQAWIVQNDWYARDAELNAFADGLAMARVRTHPNTTEQEVLDYVAKETRKRFPDKFGNPNRQTPSPVDGGAQRAGRTGQSSFRLSEEERTVMNRLVRGGHITEEQYIKDLKLVRGEK